jgi:hypothetical protein
MTLLPPDLDRSPSENSYEGFERRMILALGATVGGSSLSRALGYPSQDAFRKAFQRGRLPVLTFPLAGRRGRFAAAADIAHWLWWQRAELPPKNSTKSGGAP